MLSLSASGLRYVTNMDTGLQVDPTLNIEKGTHKI
jgi:hypothetical protein